MLMEEQTRRRMLQFAAAAGALGLAGCIGDDDDVVDPDDDDDTTVPDDDDDDTADDADDVDDTDDEEPDVPFVEDAVFVSQRFHDKDPEEMQQNPYAPNPMGIRYWVDEAQLFNEVTGEWIPLVVSDWEVDDDVIRLHVADDYTWSDGSQLDAYDVATNYGIEVYFFMAEEDGVGEGMAQWIRDVRVVDDFTVELDLYEQFAGINPDIVAHDIFDWNFFIRLPYDRFGQYYEDFREADTTEERDDIRVALTEDRWTHEDDSFKTHSIFQIENFTEAGWELSVNEDYRTADRLNWSQFEGPVGIDEGDAFRAGLLSLARGGEADRDVAPDNMSLISRGESDWGRGLAMNLNHEWYENVNVRKFLACVIDRQNFVDIIWPGGTGNPVVTGLPVLYEDLWVGDVKDDFEPYPHDYDVAAGYLEEAGFYEEDGTWYTHTDEEFAPEVKVNEWDTDQGRLIGNELLAFGLNAEVRTLEVSTYFDDLDEGNFQLATDSWGAIALPVPFHDFQTPFTGARRREGFGVPQVIEIPMPIGDVDGSLEEIDLDEIFAEMLVADEDTYREHTQLLSWAFNQFLPITQWGSFPSAIWVDDEHWDWPAEGDDRWFVGEETGFFKQGFPTANPDAW